MQLTFGEIWFGQNMDVLSRRRNNNDTSTNNDTTNTDTSNTTSNTHSNRNN